MSYWEITETLKRVDFHEDAGTFSSKERWHCERTKTSREKGNESDWPIWAAKLPHTNGKEWLPSPKKTEVKAEMVIHWHPDALGPLGKCWEPTERLFAEVFKETVWQNTKRSWLLCVIYISTCIYLYLKNTNTWFGKQWLFYNHDRTAQLIKKKMKSHHLT